MTQPDIVAATTPVVEALEELGVPHHIGGSVASSIHGVPRATLDVNLVADLRSEHVRPFVQQLKEDYYVDEAMIREALKHRGSFNVIHLSTMLKVDVFVLKSRAYDREAFGRRRLDTLEDRQAAREFYVASPEDTILNKLEWFRLGDGVSERQWRDVVGVLKVQAEQLDVAYLHRWAGELGLDDLLARALAAAGAPATPTNRSSQDR